MFSISRIALLLILFTGFLSFHAQAQTTTILLFGDSIIAGYGLSKEDSLSVQLEHSLNHTEHYLIHTEHDVKVINGGVSGDTTSAGLTRLSWTLKRTQPDLVVLALGGNDVLRGLPPRITRQNLDAMLKILQSSHVKVILSQVQAPANLGSAYQAELSNAYSSLAIQYQVPVYPFLLEDIFTTPKLMLEDGIHPSADGIKVITKQLSDYLLKVIIEQKEQHLNIQKRAKPEQAAPE